jgi:hypothetical protein
VGALGGQAMVARSCRAGISGVVVADDGVRSGRVDVPDVPGALGGLLAALGSASRSLPVGGSGSGGPAVEGVRGVGSASGGRVRAEVSAGGRLEALSIDPQVFRSGVTSLADLVVEAVRAAQDDAAARVAEVGAGVVPRPAELSAAAEAAAVGMARLDGMVAELARAADRLEGLGNGHAPGGRAGWAR